MTRNRSNNYTEGVNEFKKFKLPLNSISVSLTTLNITVLFVKSLEYTEHMSLLLLINMRKMLSFNFNLP